MLASILITTLDKGATYMSSKVGVVREISGVITSFILLFSATGVFIRHRVDRKRRELEDQTKKTTKVIGEKGGREA